MSFNWRAPGIVWAQHTGENAAIAAATAAMSVLTGSATKTLLDVSWMSVLSSAGYAALYAVLLAVMSLPRQNGTASFLPKVEAKPAPRRRAPRKTRPTPPAPTTADIKQQK